MARAIRRRLGKDVAAELRSSCRRRVSARRSTGPGRRGRRACCSPPPATATSACRWSTVERTEPSVGETNAIWPLELVSTSRLPASTGPRQKIGSSPAPTLTLSGPESGSPRRSRAAKGGELRNPADPARGARDREQLRPIGDHEHPVARDPGRRDAGDVQFPGALAGDQLDRDHPAALADREDPAIVDHRIGVDVGKGADDGRDAGPRQRVLPDDLAVLVAIGGELARRIAGDERDCAKAGAALPNTPASSNEPEPDQRVSPFWALSA